MRRRPRVALRLLFTTSSSSCGPSLRPSGGSTSDDDGEMHRVSMCTRTLSLSLSPLISALSFFPILVKIFGGGAFPRRAVKLRIFRREMSGLREGKIKNCRGICLPRLLRRTDRPISSRGKEGRLGEMVRGRGVCGGVASFTRLVKYRRVVARPRAPRPPPPPLSQAGRRATDQLRHHFRCGYNDTARQGRNTRVRTFRRASRLQLRPSTRAQPRLRGSHPGSLVPGVWSVSRDVPIYTRPRKRHRYVIVTKQRTSGRQTVAQVSFHVPLSTRALLSRALPLRSSSPSTRVCPLSPSPTNPLTLCRVPVLLPVADRISLFASLSPFVPFSFHSGKGTEREAPPRRFL